VIKSNGSRGTGYITWGNEKTPTNCGWKISLEQSFKKLVLKM
jgi:hypothetical protein